MPAVLTHQGPSPAWISHSCCGSGRTSLPAMHRAALTLRLHVAHPASLAAGRAALLPRHPHRPCTEAAILPHTHCGWERWLSSAGLEAPHHKFCLLISAAQPQEAAALPFQVSHQEHTPLWVGQGHVESGHCQGWDTGSASAEMGACGTTAGESWARAHCSLSHCTDLQYQKFSSRMPKSKSPHFPAVVKSFLYLSEQYPSEIKSPGPSSPTVEFM